MSARPRQRTGSVGILHESWARSAQQFSGTESKENMKRTNGVRATYDAFLLYADSRLALGALRS